MKRVCITIDDLDFRGGAHIATASLLRELRARGVIVDVLTSTGDVCKARDVYPCRTVHFCTPPRWGLRRIVRGIITHTKLGWQPNWTLDPWGCTRRWLEGHDVVCCIGEASIFRDLVASLSPRVRKIQLIHIDYVRWRHLSYLERAYCRFDKWRYSKLDAIGVVGCENARRMAEVLPTLSCKIKPFHNLFTGITRPHTHMLDEREPIRLISLTRLEQPQKRILNYPEIARQLVASGLSFVWDVYGTGAEAGKVQEMTVRFGLTEVLRFRGFEQDATHRISQSDLLVLLSNYEGLPNVIYESFLSGTPVFATDVGAVAEQINEGVNGWLAEVDDDAISGKLIQVLKNRNALRAASRHLQHYVYDNEAALREHLDLLGLINN